MRHSRIMVRRQLQAWEQGVDGCWQHRDVSRDLWEVVCADCGDDGGPPERQPPATARLRGPWRTLRDPEPEPGRLYRLQRSW